MKSCSRFRWCILKVKSSWETGWMLCLTEKHVLNCTHNKATTCQLWSRDKLGWLVPEWGFCCYYQKCESKTCLENRNHCYSGVDKTMPNQHQQVEKKEDKWIFRKQFNRNKSLCNWLKVWLICTFPTPPADQCSKNLSQNECAENIYKLNCVHKFKTQEQASRAQRVFFFHPTCV